MNKIILLGRLTKEPEVRVTTSEKTVCTFTLAVNRPFSSQGGEKEADFINVVVWGKTAEACGNSLGKGQRLLVEGRLQQRSYEAKDGTRKYITEVIANNVEFIEKKNAQAVSPMASMGEAVQGSFDEVIPF